jgi:chromosome segregation ATPase
MSLNERYSRWLEEAYTQTKSAIEYKILKDGTAVSLRRGPIVGFQYFSWATQLTKGSKVYYYIYWQRLFLALLKKWREDRQCLRLAQVYQWVKTNPQKVDWSYRYAMFDPDAFLTQLREAMDLCSRLTCDVDPSTELLKELKTKTSCTSSGGCWIGKPRRCYRSKVLDFQPHRLEKRLLDYTQAPLPSSLLTWLKIMVDDVLMRNLEKNALRIGYRKSPREPLSTEAILKSPKTKPLPKLKKGEGSAFIQSRLDLLQSFTQRMIHVITQVGKCSGSSSGKGEKDACKRRAKRLEKVIHEVEDLTKDVVRCHAIHGTNEEEVIACMEEAEDAIEVLSKRIETIEGQVKRLDKPQKEPKPLTSDLSKEDEEPSEWSLKWMVREVLGLVAASLGAMFAPWKWVWEKTKDYAYRAKEWARANKLQAILLVLVIAGLSYGVITTSWGAVLLSMLKYSFFALFYVFDWWCSRTWVDKFLYSLAGMTIGVILKGFSPKNSRLLKSLIRIKNATLFVLQLMSPLCLVYTPFREPIKKAVDDATGRKPPLTDCEKEAVKVEKDLAEKEAEVEKLKSAERIYEEELNRLNDAVNDADSTILNLQAKLAGLKASTDEASRKAAQDLQREINQHIKTRDTLTQKMGDLSTKHSRVASDLEDKLESGRQLLIQEEAKTRAAQQATKEAKEQVKGLEGKARQDAQRRAEEAQRRAVAATKALEEADANTANLRKRLQEERVMNAKLSFTKVPSEKEKYMAAVQKDVEEMKVEADKATAVLEARREEAKRRLKELENAKNEADLKLVEAQIRAAEELEGVRTEESQRRLRELEEAKQKANQSLSEAQAEATRFHQEARKEKAMHDQIKVTRVESEREKFMDAVEADRAKMKVVAERRAAVQAARDKAASEMQTIREAHESQLQQQLLKHKLATERAKTKHITAVARVKGSGERRIKEAQKQTNDLTAKLEESQAKVEELGKTVEKLRSGNAEDQLKAVRVEGELKRTQATVRNLQERAGKADADIVSLTASHEQRVATLEAQQREEIKQLNEANTKAQAKLSNDHTAALTKKSAEHQTALEAERKRLEKKYLDALEVQTRLARETAESEASQKIAAANADAGARVAQLKQDLQLVEAEMEARGEADAKIMAQAIDQERAFHQQRLEDLNAAYAAREAELRQELAGVQSELGKTQAEGDIQEGQVKALQRRAAQLEEELNRGTESHEAKVAELNIQIEKAANEKPDVLIVSQANGENGKFLDAMREDPTIERINARAAAQREAAVETATAQVRAEADQKITAARNEAARQVKTMKDDLALVRGAYKTKLDEELTALERERTEMMARFTKAETLSRAKWEAVRDANDAATASLRAQISELEKQIEGLKGSHGGQVADLRGQIGKLQSDLQNQTALASTTNKELESLGVTHGSALDDINENLNTIQRLEAQKASLVSQVEDAKREIADLGKDLDNASDFIKERANAAAQERDALLARLEATEEHLHTVRTKTTSNEMVLNLRIKELEEASKRASTFVSAAHDKATKEGQRQIAIALQDQSDRFDVLRRRYEEQLASVQSDLKASEEALKRTGTALASARSAHTTADDATRAEIQRLEGVIAAETSSRQALKRELGEATANLTASEQARNDLIATHRSDIAALKVGHEDAMAAQDLSHKDALATQEAQHKVDLREKGIKHGEEMAANNLVLKNLQEQFEDSKTKLGEVKSKLKTLEETTDKTKGDLTVRLSDANTDLAKVKKELEDALEDTTAAGKAHAESIAREHAAKLAHAQKLGEMQKEALERVAEINRLNQELKNLRQSMLSLGQAKQSSERIFEQDLMMQGRAANASLIEARGATDLLRTDYLKTQTKIRQLEAQISQLEQGMSRAPNPYLDWMDNRRLTSAVNLINDPMKSKIPEDGKVDIPAVVEGAMKGKVVSAGELTRVLGKSKAVEYGPELAIGTSKAEVYGPELAKGMTQKDPIKKVADNVKAGPWTPPEGEELDELVAGLKDVIEEVEEEAQKAFRSLTDEDPTVITFWGWEIWDTREILNPAFEKFTEGTTEASVLEAMITYVTDKTLDILELPGMETLFLSLGSAYQSGTLATSLAKLYPNSLGTQAAVMEVAKQAAKRMAVPR